MPFKHILIATDFGEIADRALDVAVELAQKFEAELTLVHVWEIPSIAQGTPLYWPGDIATPLHDAAQMALNHAGEALKVRILLSKTALREGVAWQEILAAADQEMADLIVLGTHGRRGLNRALVGSVAERVVRLSTTPVLTVHGTPASKSSKEL